MFSGSLKRLTIWILLIATWEAAFRFAKWEPSKFPAPSHVLDGTLSLLNVKTTFGQPLHPHWPGPAREVYPAEKEGMDAYRAGKTLEDNPYRKVVDGVVRTSEESVDWRLGFEAGAQHWWNSPLAEALAVSSVRLAIGFTLSIVIGALIGVLAWRLPAVDDFIGPVLLGVQTLPSVCWVPLAIILFSFDERAIMFVLAMGSFSAVAIALRDGLRAIPPLYQQAGRMMGARGWKLYAHVLLPAAMPALATSLRQGFSFAWRSLMGAELILVVKYHGLGHQLSVGRETGAVEQVVALLIVMILIGMFTDRWVFAILQRKISARFGLAPR
jgi:NitT/TauT family transport system permease protein